MRSLRGSWALLLALAAGCAPAVRWNREDIRPPGVKGDRQLEQAKIWSGDSVFQWLDVLITTDSISGISYKSPATCVSCRRALPLSAVDSLRVGYRGDPSSGDPFVTDLAVIGLILLALLTP